MSMPSEYNGGKQAWFFQIAAALILLGVGAFLWQGGANLPYNWQWFRIPRLLLPGWFGDKWQWGPLVAGLRLTFLLALAGIPLVAVLGLAVALAGQSRLYVLRWSSRAYIELVRNTPMLVQLYLVYFLLANIFSLERVTAGLLALTIFEGAFAAEIFRAGLLSTPRRQLDAAHSLGLSRLQTMRLVAMPQSLPLILPPLANLFVALIKHSSIVSAVAIPELTDVARNIIADTYLTFEIWLVVAAIYITLCFFLSQTINAWERRLLSRLDARTHSA